MYTKSLILLGLLCPVVLSGAPLTEAHVSKILNIVKLVDPAGGEHGAKLDDVVRDQIAVTTGIKSRSELVFEDNTLTRLGPESYFSFKTGTRDMTLQKGTLLLQIPKGLGGATIHAASITAAITGTTIMLESIPGKDIKVLVLEGTLRLSMNGRFGDSLLLTPGNMIMMSAHSRRIPDPVTIDLKKVVQTSTLVNMRGKNEKDASANSPSLPSMSLIEKEIAHQQSGKDAHKLANTNLVINGKGTSASLGPDSLLYSLGDRSAIQAAGTPSLLGPPIIAPPSLPPTPVPTPHH
jgi:hypothetical protein